MSKNQKASGITNIINYDNSGNISFVSGSTTLMSVSSSGAVVLTGTMSGGTADSASLSANSNLLQGTGSIGFATTASLLAVSSSQQQISASLLTLTASYTALSSSYTALSGSYNTFSGSASTRVTQIESTYATTGSNSFRANQSITGSLVVSSTITAQTLVVQTVTSSIVYSSGSNIFGSATSNLQTFTGSIQASGSSTHFFLGGNVGIGTTNNAAKLEIQNSPANDWGISVWGNTTVSQSYGGIVRGGTNSSDVAFRVNNAANSSTYFTVQGSGNVGIGTTSPQTNLSVKGIAANATASTYNGIFGLESVNQTSFQMGIGSTYNGTWFQSFNQPAIGGGTYPLIFNPIGGNVGIGTSSPGALLHIYDASAGSTKTYTKYSCNDGGDIRIGKQDGVNNNAVFGTWSNNDIQIYANSTERMRISSGGVVTVNQALSNYGAMAVKGNTDAATYGGLNVYNATGINFMSIAINTTRAVIGADYAASGSYMPLCFETGNTERMRISTGGIVTQPYQPAFSIANGAALTGPGTVPFKNVIFDDGSNFNTSTYRFTAPVAGRYFFSFYDNIYANLSTSPSMEFRVNGTRRGAIAYTNTKTIGYWYIMSFQQVIKLSSGDYVEVYLANGDSADYGGDYSWGNFSGFLIG